RDRVGSRLLAYFHQHRILPIEPGQGARLLHAVLGVADVGHAYRHAIDVRQDNVIKILRPRHAAERAQHQLALALIDAAARHLYVLRDQGLLDLRDGQVIRLKLLGIHPDVDLALAVAYKTHLADAADGLYLLFYFLVRDLGDLAGATSGRD